ncbi:MAG TPA: right-handed parallel beta-helix repeat-containing protein [Dyella sp.]|nr:right-handed parallel beta-helix repeat-containing protein [Dyella sp.]
MKITTALQSAQGNHNPYAGTFILNRFHSISRRKALTVAASLALSAVTLPAFATNWWTQTPSVSIGSAVVNVVNFGASGNGAMDDTAAFQAAVNALPSSGGTVIVPTGTYMINALTSINLRSHVRLSLASNAYVKAIPNSSDRYWIVKAFGVNNVEIVGGHFVGDRTNHQGTAGEWGYGILVEGSSNIYIHDLTVTNSWGDGILIRGINWDNGTVTPSNSVTLNRVTADNNRRQGLSICPANQVYVVNSSFTHSNGASPQGGIDIEPQTQGKTSQVRIENTVLSNNAGNGLEVHNNVNGVSLYKVTAENNKGYGVFTSGPTNVGISNSNLSQNYLFGVDIAGVSDYVSITNNTITYNGDSWFYAHGVSIFTEGWDPRDILIASTAGHVTQSGNTISPQK